MYEIVVKYKSHITGMGFQLKNIVEVFDKYYHSGYWKLSYCEIGGPSLNGYGLSEIEKFIIGKDSKNFMKMMPDDMQFLWGFFSLINPDNNQPIGFFESFDGDYFIIYSADIKFLKFVKKNLILNDLWKINPVFPGTSSTDTKFSSKSFFGRITKSQQSYDVLLEASLANIIEEKERW